MTGEHVPDAAGLLTERFRRELAAGRPWSGAALDAAATARLIAARLDDTEGYVCTSGTDLVGFFQAKERRGQPWVPSTWIEFTSHAARDPNAYRHLYAHASESWVEAGLMDHYAVVPVLDDVVWSVFALGFGLEQVYAIRSLEDVEVREHPSAEIRLATPDDFTALKELLEVLPIYQQKAPTFGLNTITRDELEEGHAELLADEEAHYWVAMAEGRALGFMIFEPVAHAQAPYLPERTIGLDVAAVADSQRGSGIGSALTSAGLRHAADAGFTHCITDWRSPNLLSGPTWTRWGFEPYSYRLHRTIDARLGPSSD